MTNTQKNSEEELWENLFLLWKLLIIGENADYTSHIIGIILPINVMGTDR